MLKNTRRVPHVWVSFANVDSLDPHTGEPSAVADARRLTSELKRQLTGLQGTVDLT